MKKAYSSLRCLGNFIGTLLFLVSISSALVLPWWERDVFYQEKIDKYSEQIQRFDAVAATIPTLEQRLADLRANKELDAYYIEAIDGSMGGIALQRLIEGFAREAKEVNINTAQVLPPEEQPSAIKVGVRLRFNCSIEALWQMLYAIENSKPILIISTITIRPMRQGSRRRYYRGDSQAQQEMMQDISVNMDVYGYVRRSTT